MRKEVLLAIIIGFALGLVITFGIWTANQALKQKRGKTPPSEAFVTPAETTPIPTLTLEIVSPEDGDLISEAKVMVSGRTQSGATVAIVSEKDEETIEAAEDGTFATEIQLVSGTNEITITAFSPEGEETSKTLNLVYSTAEI